MAIITGTTSDDVNLTRLVGTSSADTIFGLAGFDEIAGGAGNDTLIGGSDGDALYGGAGIDTASYMGASQGVGATLSGGGYLGDAAGDLYAGIENLSGSEHRDVLGGDARANAIRGGNGEDDLFGGEGNDRVEGGAHNDLVYGGAGADVLAGGVGNDILGGNAGRDQMTGGAGADSFIYPQLSDSGLTAETRDVITDFSRTHGDKIHLLFEEGWNFEFIGKEAFHSFGQIRFSHIDGNTRISINHDLDSAPELQITLLGLINLTESDFN